MRLPLQGRSQNSEEERAWGSPEDQGENNSEVLRSWQKKGWREFGQDLRVDEIDKRASGWDRERTNGWDLERSSFLLRGFKIFSWLFCKIIDKNRRMSMNGLEIDRRISKQDRRDPKWQHGRKEKLKFIWRLIFERDNTYRSVPSEPDHSCRVLSLSWIDIT